MITIDGITYIPVSDINFAATLFVGIILIGLSCMAANEISIFSFGLGLILAPIICALLIFASIHVRFS